MLEQKDVQQLLNQGSSLQDTMCNQWATYDSTFACSADVAAIGCILDRAAFIVSERKSECVRYPSPSVMHRHSEGSAECLSRRVEHHHHPHTDSNLGRPAWMPSGPTSALLGDVPPSHGSEGGGCVLCYLGKIFHITATITSVFGACSNCSNYSAQLDCLMSFKYIMEFSPSTLIISVCSGVCPQSLPGSVVASGHYCVIISLNLANCLV